MAEDTIAATNNGKLELEEAFEQLKVDPNWKQCDSVENADIKNHLSLREPYLQESLGGKSKSTNKNRRSEPYSKDDLPFNELLSLNLKEEKCENKNCSCNSKPMDSPLNLARACSEAKKSIVLQEPKLKLHHAQKDHKVVLRTARLRLSSPGWPATTEHKKKLKRFKRTSLPHDRLLFASTSDQDFHSIASSQSRDTGSLAQYEGKEFQRLQPHRQAEDKGLDLSSLEQVLPAEDSCPLHPGQCTRPCSCAEQAQRVDWTVDELACYFEDFVHIPKKMSAMAEMMYT